MAVPKVPQPHPMGSASLGAASMLKIDYQTEFDHFHVIQFLPFSWVISYPDPPPSLAQCTAAWALVLSQRRWFIWLVWQDGEVDGLEGWAVTNCIYFNDSCTYFIAISDTI